MQIHPTVADQFIPEVKRGRMESSLEDDVPKELPEPHSSKARWKVGCVIISMYVGAVYITVCQAVLWYMAPSSSVSLRALILSTKAISGAISVHMVSLVYEKISKRLTKDEAILGEPTVTSTWTGTGDLRPRRRDEIKTLRVVAVVAITLYVVGIASAIAAAEVFDGTLDISFGAAIWGNRIAGVLRHVISLSDMIMCNVILFVPLIVVHWYINICLWTHARVLFFREKIYALLDDTTRVVSALDIKSLQNLYNHLSSTVSNFDRKLGKAVFIWHANFILVTILSARGVRESPTWSTKLETSSHSACSVILFFVISLVAANIVVESNNIDYDLCRLVCQIDFSDWRASNQIMLLQEEIQQASLAFTGWNCFTVDRGYILTVVGAVITYAVVLQQLIP